MTKLDVLKRNIERNQKAGRMSLNLTLCELERKNKQVENGLYRASETLTVSDILGAHNAEKARLEVLNRNYKAYEGLVSTSAKLSTEEVDTQGCKIKVFTDKKPQKHIKAPPTIMGCNFNEELYQESLAKYKTYNTFVSKRTGDEISLDDLIFSNGTVRERKKQWYKFW